jgi:membrane-bound ClpP family serine protease
MNRFSFALLILLLLMLAGLVYTASEGNVFAAGALGAILAIVCILIGVGLTVLAIHASGRREQATFNANARENLQIMSAMQRVQNAQNTALMRQAVAASRGLPPGQSSGSLSGLGDALLMEEDVFSELEE